MTSRKHDLPGARDIGYGYSILGLPDRGAMAAQRRRVQKWLHIPGAL